MVVGASRKRGPRHERGGQKAAAPPAARRPRSCGLGSLGVQSRLYSGAGLERAVHQLLALAANIWDSLRIAPHPALDAVNAPCRFGRYLPASAVDPVLAILAPALQPGNTLAPETVSLLIQVYWAVPGRRDDLAAIISTQLSRPDPPPGLWVFVTNMPKQAREPLAPAVSALGKQGNHAALLTLATWRVPASAVQAAARAACADLLRQPTGTLAGTWPLSSQYSETAVLLAALAAADTVSAVDPHDLRPSTGNRPGMTLGSMTLFIPPTPSATPADVPRTPDAGSPQAPPPGDILPGDWVPDQAAIIAAGSPTDVIEAAVQRFLLIAENRETPAFARTDALVAIRTLIPHLPSEVAHSRLAERLLELAGNPNFNEFDQAELQSQDLLSRGRLNTGARQMPALALLIAAEAAEEAAKGEPEIDRMPANLLQQLAISAAALLNSPDPDTAKYAAAALAHASKTDPSLAGFATALVTSSSEQTRNVAAALVNLDQTTQHILAADPAPQVRVTLASRARELTPEVLNSLREDANAEVIHALTATTATEAGTSPEIPTAEES